MAPTQRLGVDIVASGKTDAAFNSSKELLDQVQAAQKAVNSFAGPMRQAESATARFSSRIQNASFKLSDFTVKGGRHRCQTPAAARYCAAAMLVRPRLTVVGYGSMLSYHQWRCWT
ncbi:hypothetical protein [Aestuariivirga sp.]|uniref:hypothetical protein n=1 Tax=Aestuariivirga sp. TaxID=2650926 RepID=UPI003BA88EA6